jgi:hypothetical protein
MAETEPGDVEVTITVTLTRKEVLLLSAAIEGGLPPSATRPIMSAFKDRCDLVDCHGSMQGKVQRAILDVAAPPRPPWHGPRGTGQA